MSILDIFDNNYSLEILTKKVKSIDDIAFRGRKQAPPTIEITSLKRVHAESVSGVYELEINFDVMIKQKEVSLEAMKRVVKALDVAILEMYKAECIKIANEIGVAVDLIAKDHVKDAQQVAVKTAERIPI